MSSQGQQAKPATPATPAKPATPSAAAAPKEKKPVAPKTVAGHPLSAVIRMGKNKDGKPYGADNNPKRAGTACHGRFAKYVDGKTIEETLKIPGGPVTGDMIFDSAATRGYITIVDPPKTA